MTFTLFEGYNYTDPSVLRPGASRSLTLTIGSHFDGAHTVNVRVEAKG